MTAKELFSSALVAQRELERLKLQREKLLVLAGPATAQIKETVSHGNLPSSRVEICVESLDELDHLYIERTTSWMDLIREADRIIMQIKKPRQREVLQLRYMCGLKWEEIREKMEYSDVRSVHKMHGWALAEADRVIESHGRSMV